MPADFDISPIIPPIEKAVPPPRANTVFPEQSASPAPTFPPSMSPKNNANRALKWLILVAAGLFVVTVGSLWWGGNSFSDKGVTLTVDGPERATSGDEVTYTIKYQNDTKVSLTDMSFRVFYPEDSIVMKDGQPTNPESEGFEVSELQAGESGEKKITLFLVGDKGAIKSLRTHLIFRAGTLRSAFEKEATTSTTITDLPATLTLVAPPTSVAGQPVQYILDIRNDSNVDLADLKAVFTYPDGFVVQKMQPNPDQGNTDWSIAQLRAGEGKRIVVSGVLDGEERTTKTVGVVLQHRLNGQFVDYVRTEAFTVISSPLLTVTVTPKDGRDYVSFAGDSLRYTVSYRNNSQYTLLGLLLGVKLEGDMYDFTQLKADRGFFDDATKTVAFDSAGVPELAALRPGQSGSVVFTVPLKAGFEGSGGGAKSLFVKATARLSTSNVPSGIDGEEVFALDSLITKISSQPALVQTILYDDGAGSGPMPFQVGQETVVTVRWQLTNPGNDIRDTVVTATLPPGVTFVGGAVSSNGTPPVFNRTTNKITWTVGTLPFGTGNGTPRFEGTFQISVRPSSNQQGQAIMLVTGATLTGTDGFTGQPQQVRLRDADSNNIENHIGQGRVQ